MAQNVDFILNLNGDQARKVLLDLHRQGNTLFSKNGYQLNLDSKGFNRSLDQATNRVLSFTAATTVLASVGVAMRRLATDAISVETAISKIQSILQATSSDLNSFTSSLFDLANKTGLGFTDAAMAAEEFSRQGLSLEKTLKATEAAMSLARVSGGNLTKTVGDLVAISSAFGNEALAYSEVADTLGALDAAFSTTTTGLAEGLARVASIANDVGVSFTEMSALIAATKQVTGRSEAVIGNAFKSIFTNIGTEKVQEELRAIGVETRNLDGSFIDAEKVLENLAKAYENLTDAQQANITFKVAGKYNKNVLQGAIFAQNQGVSQKALDVANNAGGSIAERLATLNDTTATSLQRLQNAVTQLATTNIGGIFTDAIKDLSGFATNAVKTLGSIFEKENPVGKALAAGISGVLSGPVLILGGALIFKLIKKIGVDLLNAGKSVFGINSGFASSQGLLKGITSQLSQQVALMERLAALSGKAYTKGASASASATSPFSSTLPPVISRRFVGKDSLPTPLSVNYKGVGKATRGKRGRMSTLEKDQLAYRQSSLPISIFNARGQSLVDARARSVERAGASARGLESFNNTPLRNKFFGIDKEVKSLALRRGVDPNGEDAKQKIAGAKQVRSERIRGGAFGASFLAPLVGSAIGGAIGGKGGRLAESAGQGVGIAAIGVSIGGIAAPIAAVVGGFKFLSTVTEELFGNFQELTNKAGQSIANLDKQNQAGDEYIRTRLALDDAIASGDQNLIKRSQANVLNAAGELKGGQKNLLLEKDSSKLVSIQDNLTTTSESLKAASLSTIEVNKLVEESYAGLFDKAGQLLGSNNSLTRESSAPLVDAFAKSLDPKLFSRSPSDLLKEKDSSDIQGFVKNIISGSATLKSSFSLLSEKFEGGSEAFSLYLVELLSARESQKTLAEAQQKVVVASQDVQNSFKRIISRSLSFENNKQENILAGLKNDLKVTEILGARSVDPAIQETLARDLAEVQISASQDQLKVAGEFKDKISTLLQGSAQGSDELEKVSNFLKNLADPKYNIGGIVQDIQGLGLGGVAINSVRDSLSEVNDQFEKVSRGANLSSESLKKLADAESRANLKRQALNRFGNIDEDQTESIQKLSAGKAAVRSLAARRLEEKKLAERQGRKPKNIDYTAAEADTIRAADIAQKALGREDSFSAADIASANKIKVESVAKAQASSVISDKINSIFTDPSNKFISPSSQAVNKGIAGKIEASIGEGDFGTAEKLAGDFNLQPAARKEIANEIFKESVRFNQAPETAALTVQDKIALNTQNTADYTKALLDAQKQKPITSSIDPKKVADIQGRIFNQQSVVKERSQDVLNTTSRLEEVNLKLQEMGRKDTDFELALNKATVGKGGVSQLGKEAYGKLGFIDSRYVSLGLGDEFIPDSALGSQISKNEADVFRQSREVPEKERERFLLNQFGSSRYTQLKEGVGKILPNLGEARDKGGLEFEQQKLEKELRTQKDEERRAIVDQLRLQEAADSMQTSVGIFKAGVDAFSKGTTQTNNNNVVVTVNGTGAGAFDNPKVTQEIVALVNKTVDNFWEEATGSKAVRAPSTPTVTAIA